MSGKARHNAKKRKTERFNKQHPEGRTIYALRKKITKFTKQDKDTSDMQKRLKRIDKQA